MINIYMKVHQLFEARYVGKVPGLYQRYDRADENRIRELGRDPSTYDFDDTGWTVDYVLVEEEKFWLTPNDIHAQGLISQLPNNEFVSLYTGWDQSYTHTEDFAKMSSCETVISCGADWGEGGHWYYGFNIPNNQLYFAIEKIIRSFNEKQLYDLGLSANSFQKLLDGIKETLEM